MVGSAVVEGAWAGPAEGPAAMTTRWESPAHGRVSISPAMIFSTVSWTAAFTSSGIWI